MLQSYAHGLGRNWKYIAKLKMTVSTYMRAANCSLNAKLTTPLIERNRTKKTRIDKGKKKNVQESEDSKGESQFLYYRQSRGVESA
ncbi:hypothetical protein LTR10_024477 [Elasticomyces elasticus]|uniref:Uncharacterized protein n=1 Tax=Exophiala sideris TaxID=1016849 RepID=A0ABR0J8K6_9EURO|nr:hypothetical protein LTR10_024477 [Elasticomyces elasticus]KAK5022180.1 hypothetical protein LTS07_010259 [Exophiala sideris]KAK5037379.1 hypothetical protein LTR13_004536 [Exophiala sideris]KAK5059041.1 hypothetical protein LTR69_006330 [Exophiala sideris]KAK5182874.1 hypothetical protein LTR44_004584 [Eurotiomycetes sp. CCFEE 6388]